MWTTLPNLLTLSRIATTPLICGLLVQGSTAAAWIALGLFIVSCVTDFLDGYLARKRQQFSALGRTLDPIADKLLVAAVLLTLIGMGRIDGAAIIAAALILLREILVSGLREHLAEDRVVVPVTKLAKWKTTVQMVALALLVAGDAVTGATSVGIVMLWLAAALTVITGYGYARAALAHTSASTTSQGQE